MAPDEAAPILADFAGKLNMEMLCADLVLRYLKGATEAADRDQSPSFALNTICKIVVYPFNSH